MPMLEGRHTTTHTQMLAGDASALIASPTHAAKGSRAHGASDAGHLTVPGSTTDDTSDGDSDSDEV